MPAGMAQWSSVSGEQGAEVGVDQKIGDSNFFFFQMQCKERVSRELKVFSVSRQEWLKS